MESKSIRSIENDNKGCPPRIPPRLKSAPRIRQFYWCDFPKDAQLPEFWKRRPVIILSPNSKLNGTVAIIPCSTQHQKGNKFAFKLGTTIDNVDSWAICDKITTVAVSRLLPNKKGMILVPEKEFNGMLSL